MIVFNCYRCDVTDQNQIKTYLNDIEWPSMWYLNRGEKGQDMNVEEAWALGMTGKGKKMLLKIEPRYMCGWSGLFL